MYLASKNTDMCCSVNGPGNQRQSAEVIVELVKLLGHLHLECSHLDKQKVHLSGVGQTLISAAVVMAFWQGSSMSEATKGPTSLPGMPAT